MLGVPGAGGRSRGVARARARARARTAAAGAGVRAAHAQQGGAARRCWRRLHSLDAARVHLPPPRMPTPTTTCATGGIKRWGFARGLMTHGSKSKREHGSTGPGSTPGRVFPGLKAAGQMGNVRAKMRKVEVSARAAFSDLAVLLCWRLDWPRATRLRAALQPRLPCVAAALCACPGSGRVAGVADRDAGWRCSPLGLLRRSTGPSVGTTGPQPRTRGGAVSHQTASPQALQSAASRRRRRVAARARRAHPTRLPAARPAPEVADPPAAAPRPRGPQVLMVDAEKGAIVVKGSLPGKPGNLLEIAPAKQVGKNV